MAALAVGLPVATYRDAVPTDGALDLNPPRFVLDREARVVLLELGDDMAKRGQK